MQRLWALCQVVAEQLQRQEELARRRLATVEGLLDSDARLTTTV